MNPNVAQPATESSGKANFVGKIFFPSATALNMGEMHIPPRYSCDTRLFFADEDVLSQGQNGTRCRFEIPLDPAPVCATMRDMSLANSTSIRLSEETKRRLDAIAERSGLNAADLVRIATQQYLAQIESTGSINISVGVREERAPYGTPAPKKKNPTGSQ